jgi:hypothetical protein
MIASMNGRLAPRSEMRQPQEKTAELHIAKSYNVTGIRSKKRRPTGGFAKRMSN